MRAWNAGFHDLSRIFAPLASLDHGGERAAVWPELDDFNAFAARHGLQNAAGRPLRFVAAAPRPRRGRRAASGALSYEEQVLLRGEVPTRRHSWHDYFNMRVWGLLPRTKAALNERQVSQGRGNGSKTRTREQDRLAMFDEGGAIVVVPHGSLPEGLATSGPAAAPPWLVVVGHAVYESVILTPERGIRLFTLVLAKGPEFFALSLAAQIAAVDADAAAAVRAGHLAPAAAEAGAGVRLTGLLLKDITDITDSTDSTRDVT